MSWITSLFSFISAPIADLSGSYRERKRIAAEMAASIATAEGNLKLAKLDAESKRLANQEGNDADYDLQVLKNRRESIMDEIHYYGIFGIVHCALCATTAAVYGEWLAGYGL